MSRGKKDINLLSVLEGRPQRTFSPLRVAGLTAIPVVAFVAFATTFYLVATTSELSAERDSLARFVQGEQTARASKENSASRADADVTMARADALEALLKNLSSYPDLSREQFVAIYDLAGTSIDISKISYDRRTGILKFEATASELSSLPFFVQRMRASGMFADIQYRGYLQTKTGSSYLGSSTSTNTTGSPQSYSGQSSSSDAADTVEAASGSQASASASSAAYIPQRTTYQYSIECLIIRPAAKEINPLPTGSGASGAGAGSTDAQAGGGE